MKKNQVQEMEDTIADLTVERDRFKAKYNEFMSLSWWERMFI